MPEKTKKIESGFDLFQSSYKLQIQELSTNQKNIEKDAIINALKLLYDCKGKLVVTGMGKSGLIAQKLAATFSSTGTPSFFMHPGESLHGDLGCLQKNDIMMVIAKSGESEEVTSMLRVVNKMGNSIIAILGNPNSTAGQMSSVIIKASVSREADPLNLAPTASTTVALVVGDSLASAMAQIRGFQPEHFALFHPAGQLGKRLLLKVEDLLNQDHGIPVVKESSSMEELLNAQSGPNLGGVIIVNNSGKLSGIITDGDIRRAILKFNKILDCKLSDLMTPDPVYVLKGTLAISVLRLMQNRKSQISVMPVVDPDMRPVGLIRVHDLIGAGL